MADTDDRAAAVRKGDKRAVAALVSEIESAPQGALHATLDVLYATPRGHVLGITGPPGVGKSTLIRRLIEIWRGVGESVGVLAIDPSSRISGGALLGDRLRMASSGSDEGVFIRSMAAGDQFGGLARAAFAAVTVLRAGFDHVVVETVGVGQSETGIADLADTVLLCIQPNSGDVVQFMKAGIMETPDILTVTKTDAGTDAGRTLAEVRAALALMTPREGWCVPAVGSAAAAPDGLDDLMTALESHRNWLSVGGRIPRRREGQAAAWLRSRLAEDYGRAGLGWIMGERPHGLENPDRPFALSAELERLLAEKTGFG